MPQGENLAPEWKVRIMKNDKSEYPGVVEVVSRFAGAFVGTLMVGCKEMASCIKDITKPKPQLKPEPIQKLEPESIPKPIPKPRFNVSTKVAEKSVEGLSEKKSSPTAKDKKKTTSRQAKVKKKVEKPKSSTHGQNRHPKSKVLKPINLRKVQNYGGG